MTTETRDALDTLGEWLRAEPDLRRRIDRYREIEATLARHMADAHTAAA
jgi:hypothetical protein